jgi:hypothetical protein
MATGVWKKGWFWGVVGSILILTVPAIILTVLGIAPNGQTSDGNGGIRAWSIGIFGASNHIEVHQSNTNTQSQTIIHQNAPQKKAKGEGKEAEKQAE